MTDSNVTFKQYIKQSRQQLEAAMNSIPMQVQQYKVKTYCRLMVGESTEDKKSIALKPGQTISILWKYLNENDPLPVNIKFNDVEQLDSAEQFDLYWSKSQLTKWLIKNTKTGRTK